MLDWKLILAIYLSGLFVAMWKLWLPTHREIQRIAPHSLVGKFPFTMGITILLMFMFVWPVVVFISMSDELSENFKENFIEGAVKENERE